MYLQLINFFGEYDSRRLLQLIFFTKIELTFGVAVAESIS